MALTLALALCWPGGLSAAAEDCPVGRVCLVADGKVVTAPLAWNGGVLAPGAQLQWEVAVVNHTANPVAITVRARPRLTLGPDVLAEHDLVLAVNGKAMSTRGGEGFVTLTNLVAQERRVLRFTVEFPRAADNRTQGRRAQAELVLALEHPGSTGPTTKPLPGTELAPGRLPNTGATAAAGLLGGVGLVVWAGAWAVARRGREGGPERG